MDIFCIQSFLNELNELVAHKSFSYKTLKQDIVNYFLKHNDVKLFKNNPNMRLWADNNFQIFKRYLNIGSHIKASNGARLIFLLHVHADYICLLTVYPKRGGKQKIDIGDDELFDLLSQFKKEKIACTLHLLDNNTLEPK